MTKPDPSLRAKRFGGQALRPFPEREGETKTRVIFTV